MTASVRVAILDQLGVADELQVAALDGGDGAALGVEQLRQLVQRLAPVG